jgi:hypothetical protein
MLLLKPDEMKDVERFAKEHPFGRLLAEMKNWQFQVDDILIRTFKDLDGNSSVEMVSAECQVPKKYRVMLIDDVGIPWVKQLSVRGGLGVKLYCLANVDIERYKYKVDPEQLEATLLGVKYDPRIEYKRMRKDKPEYGA